MKSYARLFSLALRTSGLAGKFLVILLIAKTLSLEELGTYGLIAAAATYGAYVAGVDFYVYAGRALASSPKSEWRRILFNQAHVYTATHILIIPILLGLAYFDIVPSKYITITILLTIAEHISQETTRALVITGNPITASLTIFLRSGAWCYIFALIYIITPQYATLNAIFSLWIIADLAAIGCGVKIINCLPYLTEKPKPSLAWIISGLRVAIFYFIGTLALRSIFIIDRYILEQYSGREQVGVYALYIGIATTLIMLLDSTVFSHDYPSLISAQASEGIDELQSRIKKFYKKTIRVTIFGSISIAVGTHILVIWLNKPELHRNHASFYLILVSMALYGISHAPHYVLYAFKKDREVLKVTISGFFVFFGMLLSLARPMGMVAVGIALNAGFMTILLGKEIMARRTMKLQYPTN